MDVLIGVISQYLLLVLIAILVLAVLVTWFRLQARRRRQASAVAATLPSELRVARQGWEMCVVSIDEADAYVEYWDVPGPERKSLAVTEQTDTDSTSLRVRRVLAQLGDGGWEMTGVDGPRLFFKRPKR